MSIKLLWKTLGVMVALAVVYLIGDILYQERADLRRVLSTTGTSTLAVHFFFVVAYFVTIPFIWRMVVRAAGVNAGARAILSSAYLPNLGKYVPGKVWSVAGRALLLRQLAPTSASRAILATLMQYGFEIAGACAFVLVYVASAEDAPDSVVMLAAPLAVVPLAALAPERLLRAVWPRARGLLAGFDLPEEPPAPAPAIIVAITFQWSLYAASGTALVAGLTDLGPAALVAAGAAFVVAWLVGFISFLTPSGIGVREGVGIALLAPIIEADVAALAMVFARLTWTAADALTILAGLAAASGADPSPGAGASGR